MDHQKAENVSLYSYCMNGKYDALMELYETPKSIDKPRPKPKNQLDTHKFTERNLAKINNYLNLTIDEDSFGNTSLRNEYSKMIMYDRIGRKSHTPKPYIMTQKPKSRPMSAGSYNNIGRKQIEI